MSEEGRQAWKRAASVAAVQAEVRSGMVVGLGTGTTACFVLHEIARQIREEGLQVRGVATSLATAELAETLGIPLTDLTEIPDVDLDGADEIDPRGNLTKGGGGAMTREKCVAVASRRLVIVADITKRVRRLKWPVPVEVLGFATAQVERELRERFPGCFPMPRIRRGTPFVTDNGNPILDVSFGPSRPPPRELAQELKQLTGVVDHGLCVGMRPRVYIGGPRGVRVLPSAGHSAPPSDSTPEV